MKFPPFADLDEDQRSIYADSPREGAIIITGPPGSGKTVVALHRAFRLSTSGKPVTLIMFNKVLARYTANFPDMPTNVTIQNMHVWIKDWYRHAFGRNFPKVDKYNPDWDLIREEIREANKSVLNRLNWGHLIIDEGQDFPSSMYRCLQFAMRRFNKTGLSSASLTVFADENQTIFDNNSSIQELTEELNVSIHDSRLWRLTKNYRNSKEIALFSRFYQLEDISSTTLPDRDYGFRPTVFLSNNTKDFHKQIVDMVNNLGDVEAGVIHFSTSRDVKSHYYKIRKLVEDRKLNIRTQTYVSGNPKFDSLADPKGLKFDAPPSITVLHSQSSKGLEFDIVFLVNIEALSPFDAAQIASYKKLYVTSSRARSTLVILMGFDEDDGLPRAASLLPSPSDEISDFVSLQIDPSLIDAKLTEVEWLPSAMIQQRTRIHQNNLIEKILKLPTVKARELLRECAERKNKLHVIKTNIDDVLSSKSSDQIENLILDLGVQQVAQKLT